MKNKTKKGFLNTLISDIAIIIMAGLIGGLIMYYYQSNTVEEEYESTAKIYVSNYDDESESIDAQAELILARDCAQLVTNRTVMTQVIAGLDLSQVYADMRGITAEELGAMVSVNIPDDSRIISVTVRDVSPVRARGLADAIAAAAAEYMKQELGVLEAKVIENANMPSEPVAHTFEPLVVMGAVIGIAAAIIIIAIVFAGDRKIKKRLDVERCVGLPVLSSIPFYTESDVNISDAGKDSKKDDKSKKSKEDAKEE